MRPWLPDLCLTWGFPALPLATRPAAPGMGASPQRWALRCTDSQWGGALSCPILSRAQPQETETSTGKPGETQFPLHLYPL